MTELTQSPLPQHPKLDELIAVLARLRAPGGCAWDAEQTHESLVPHLIEESSELVEAIESGTRDDLIEELGDVLYQVIFHADIASALTGPERFDLEDVAARMTAKMVGRHPQVFVAGAAEATSAEVVARWDELKQQEKPHRTSVLDGIPLGMPSLALADKLIGRAHKIGVLEPGDPEQALASDEEELGAILLAIVSSAKAGGLDSERALRGTLRALRAEIRDAEAGVDPFDAGIIGLG